MPTYFIALAKNNAMTLAMEFVFRGDCTTVYFRNILAHTSFVGLRDRKNKKLIAFVLKICFENVLFKTRRQEVSVILRGVVDVSFRIEATANYSFYE